MKKYKINKELIKNYEGIGNTLSFRVSTAHTLLYNLKSKKITLGLSNDLPKEIPNEILSANLSVTYANQTPNKKNPDLVTLLESKIIGHTIEKFRNEVSISCVQFAEVIGAEPSNVKAWEKGSFLPSLTYLARIKLDFGIDLLEIACNVLKGEHNG